MLEPQRNPDANCPNPSMVDVPEVLSSSAHFGLQPLSEIVGPVVLDGNAIATILSEERVETLPQLLELFSRIERDYSEALGALRQVLRPGESLASFQINPVEKITKEQFGALVELHIQRIKSSPQLPSFSNTSRPRPETEIDGDILGLLPASSTITLRDVETLSAAAVLCKRLLGSAEVKISGENNDLEGGWPSREETLGLFASILFRRAALGNTVQLPNIPYWLRQLEEVSLSGLPSSGGTPEVPGPPKDRPIHIQKHRRSA